MPYYPPQSEKPSDPPASGNSSRRRIILRRAAVLVSLLLIVYGAVRLIGYGSDLIASRQTTQELRNLAAETDVPTETAPSAGPATDLPAPETEGPAAPPAD